MAGGFLAIAQFMDEFIGAATAMVAYASHKNESKLSMDLLKYVFSAIEDIIGDIPDELEEKVKNVVASAVGLIGDIIRRL